MSAGKAEAVELNTIVGKDTLDTTLDVLGTWADEAIFRLGKDGLDVSLVDPANVGMHKVDVRPSAFEHTPEGSFPVGLNISRLQDYIGKASNDEIIDLGYKAESRKLNVRYTGYDFNIACIDPDSIRQEPDVPDLDLPNTFVVDRSALADALDVADMVSDHVHINCYPDEKEVEIYAEGDTDDVSRTFDEDDLLPGTQLTEETVSWFSVDYLYGGGEGFSGIIKSMPNGEVECHVGQEHPIKLFYTYADGNADVETMLAPRLPTG